MRTNVVLNDELMEKAMRYTGLTTKRAVIEEALRLLVRLKSQEEVLNLRGKLHWEGDLEAMRLNITEMDSSIVDS
ncbi:MAG: type II toxin-antitoxin system VapB family antitoxin [Caldilineaceae bacterium]|nr:type II toxin-antitoxin system VapB family antitoxin [Caldilineaceae bacterium]